MSARTVIVIVLAIVCGLSAAIGIQLVMRKPSAPIKTEPVLYAAADIQRGETIDEKMIEIRKVPVGQIPPGALSKLEDVIGRAAHYPMLKGDALADAKLTAKGAGGGMASLIRPGMRAFTIQTPTLSASLAGFLLPGNKVDVLLTTSSNSNDGTASASTTTLLQNVEILAVHTNVDSPAENKIDPSEARSVTLLVTPDDASLLDLGQNKGTLHLTLRNPKDTDSGPRKQATAADLHLPNSNPEPPSETTSSPDDPVETALDDVDLADRIEPGMRAFTIETRSFSSHDNLLTEERRVDVFHTIISRSGRSSTSVLLQDVKVLHVQKEGLSIGASDSGTPVAGGSPSGSAAHLVTLMVTLEECLLLDHGQKTGTFSLSLRNDEDASYGNILQASLSDNRVHVTMPLVTTSIRTLRGTRGGADRVAVPIVVQPHSSRRSLPELTLHPANP
jgi:pilus assembly protein CpaB